MSGLRRQREAKWHYLPHKLPELRYSVGCSGTGFKRRDLPSEAFKPPFMRDYVSGILSSCMPSQICCLAGCTMAPCHAMPMVATEKLAAGYHMWTMERSAASDEQ